MGSMGSLGTDRPRPSGSSRRPRKRRWLRRLLVVAALLMVLPAGAVVLFFVLTGNPTPGPFYTPPEDLAVPPGTVLRSEPFDTSLPDGAQGWRVLYASTDEHGEPVAVSGLVLAPANPGPGPHPMLAWAHGTTGIDPTCAPSLADAPFEGIPDLSVPLAEGWVVTLTDYPGLGTPGPHPYLVGPSEGRAVLDSVRAVHALDQNLGLGLGLSDEYLIWGHSQGGHAALFAGQLAPDYLPERDLVAVAALAPATRLRDNLEAIEGTEAGDVLTVLAIESWSRYYPDVSTDVLVPEAQRPARTIAGSCLNEPSRYRVLVADVTLPDPVTTDDLTTDPGFATHLDQNSPSPAGIEAPLLVAQGLTDQVISPAVTEAWVADRCSAGSPTDWRSYPGTGHLGVIGHAGADTVVWSLDQLSGTAQPGQCPTP